MCSAKVFVWLSIVSAFIAAALWLRSATCKVTKHASQITDVERGIWLHTRHADVRENPFLSAKKQNAWSAAAAVFAALAAVFQALSSIVGT